MDGHLAVTIKIGGIQSDNNVSKEKNYPINIKFQSYI